jgi:hypothetical protein
MAVMGVCNDSNGWLVLWLEPLGEDRWLKPGEELRIRTDYHGDDVAFTVRWWADSDDQAAGIGNITVWVENGSAYGDADVTDTAGNAIGCGHQRPADADRKRARALDEACKRAPGQAGSGTS